MTYSMVQFLETNFLAISVYPQEPNKVELNSLISFALHFLENAKWG